MPINRIASQKEINPYGYFHDPPVPFSKPNQTRPRSALTNENERDEKKKKKEKKLRGVIRPRIAAGRVAAVAVALATVVIQEHDT